MKKKILQIFLITFLILGFTLADSTKKNADNTAYAATAYDSLESYENEKFGNFSGDNWLKLVIQFLKNLISILYTCVAKKSVFNYNNFRYNCIPDVIGKNISYKCAERDTKKLKFTSVSEALNRFIGVGIAIIALIWLPFLAVAVFFGAVYLFMAIVKCIGTYVWAPHEVVNSIRFGDKYPTMCKRDGVKVYRHPHLLSADDVPFFYTCKGSDGSCGEQNNSSTEKKPYGYMGGTYYCNNSNAKNATENLTESKGINVKPQPGMIVYAQRSFIESWKGSKDCPAKPSSDTIKIATKEDIEEMKYPASDIIYYMFSGGKVKLCVAARSIDNSGIVSLLLPVLYGCTSVAPPYEQPTEAEITQMQRLSKTRCNYFLTQRNDLIRLAIKQKSANTKISDDSSVINFLYGDMHLTSTIVGCMKDILNEIVVSPNDPDASYMKFVQKGMRNIVMAVLTLYIMLVGFKILSAAQVPQKGEWIMFMIKFAIVMTLGTGDIWYNNNKVTGETGLYSFFLDVTEKISDIFIQSSDVNDPIKPCYLKYTQGASTSNNDEEKNDNLLRSVNINIGCGGTLSPSNKNEQNVIVTPWDFLDCKIANYLSFGSCRYTFGSMVSLWINTALLMSGIDGFLMAIVMFVYIFLMLSIIFKFVHVVLLSAFMLAILSLMAPIFSCFILFDYTKEIFQNWVKMLIGYTIYPGMTFSFVALMIATLDSMFYGFTAADLGKDKSPCQDVSSVYCAVYNSTKSARENNFITHQGNETYDINNITPETNCRMSIGGIVSSLTEEIDFIIFRWYIARESFIGAIWDPMWNMLLFALIFYFFAGSIISFFEYMSGVYGLSSIAKGDLSGAATYLGGKLNPLAIAKGAYNLKNNTKKNDKSR